MVDAGINPISEYISIASAASKLKQETRAVYKAIEKLKIKTFPSAVSMRHSFNLFPNSRYPRTIKVAGLSQEQLSKLTEYFAKNR